MLSETGAPQLTLPPTDGTVRSGSTGQPAIVPTLLMLLAVTTGAVVTIRRVRPVLNRRR